MPVFAVDLDVRIEVFDPVVAQHRGPSPAHHMKGMLAVAVTRADTAQREVLEHPARLVHDEGLNRGHAQRDRARLRRPHDDGLLRRAGVAGLERLLDEVVARDNLDGLPGHRRSHRATELCRAVHPKMGRRRHPALAQRLRRQRPAFAVKSHWPQHRRLLTFAEGGQGTGRHRPLRPPLDQPEDRQRQGLQPVVPFEPLFGVADQFARSPFADQLQRCQRPVRPSQYVRNPTKRRDAGQNGQ